MIPKMNKRSYMKMIIVMILGDGYIGTIKQGKYKYKKISYWSNDIVLRKIFIDLMKNAFNITPSHIGEKEVYYKRKIEMECVFRELKKITEIFTISESAKLEG